VTAYGGAKRGLAVEPSFRDHRSVKLERATDRPSITGRDEIEQQSLNDRQFKPCSDSAFMVCISAVP
jgi:hypothetical protein